MPNSLYEQDWLQAFLIPMGIRSITVNMSGCGDNGGIDYFTFRDEDGKELSERDIKSKLQMMTMPHLNGSLFDSLQNMAYRDSGSGWEINEGGTVESHYILHDDRIETEYVDVQYNEEYDEEYDDDWDEDNDCDADLGNP